jgi:hypothetical protein
VRLAGGATVVIPPGAVSADGHLIARAGSSRAGTKLSLNGSPATTRSVFESAGNQVKLELTGARLIHPAVLTVRADPALLQQAGGSANRPNSAWLAFYDAAGNRWQPVVSRYDSVTHSVSAQVSHLRLWAPFTFAWQPIGALLRKTLSGLLSERAPTTPCPGVNGVVISNSGGPDGPVKGCPSQAGSGQLMVTITSNRDYAMIVPTPQGVTMEPQEYTGYTEFLRTRPNAVKKLGGEYLAPTASLAYTMSLYGSPVLFSAAASVKTYLLDVGIILTRSILNIRTAGLSDCLLDNMANSGALPLSAAPGLLVECLPVIGGAAKEAWAALGDFLAAVAFAKEEVGAVLDLNGDARSGFTGTVQVKRLSLPLPEFYFATQFEQQKLYADPAFPNRMGIDNVDWISINSVNSWTPDSVTMTGVLNYNNCQPDCPNGQLLTFPVQVVATSPQTCTVQVGWTSSSSPQTAYVYSRINVQALSGSPPAFPLGNLVFNVCDA